MFHPRWRNLQKSGRPYVRAKTKVKAAPMIQNDDRQQSPAKLSSTIRSEEVKVSRQSNSPEAEKALNSPLEEGHWMAHQPAAPRPSTSGETQSNFGRVNVVGAREKPLEPMKPNPARFANVIRFEERLKNMRNRLRPGKTGGTAKAGTSSRQRQSNKQHTTPEPLHNQPTLGSHKILPGIFGETFDSIANVVGDGDSESAHSQMVNLQPLPGAKWYHPERWIRVGALALNRYRWIIRLLLIAGGVCLIILVLIPALL